MAAPFGIMGCCPGRGFAAWVCACWGADGPLGCVGCTPRPSPVWKPTASSALCPAHVCSHMLASCTPAARKVVMMDVRGFKEKADRCGLLRYMDVDTNRAGLRQSLSQGHWTCRRMHGWRGAGLCQAHGGPLLPSGIRALPCYCSRAPVPVASLPHLAHASTHPGQGTGAADAMLLTVRLLQRR